MQIILTQEEIEEAIEGHVRSQISIAENQKVSVDLKSTRGETGFTAILDIRAPAVTKAKPTTRTRTASVAAVVEEEAPEALPEAADIPETSPESTEEEDEVAAAIPDAPEADAAEGETDEPRKGSIFNFAGKAGS